MAIIQLPQQKGFLEGAADRFMNAFIEAEENKLRKEQLNIQQEELQMRQAESDARLKQQSIDNARAQEDRDQETMANKQAATFLAGPLSQRLGREVNPNELATLGMENMGALLNTLNDNRAANQNFQMLGNQIRDYELLRDQELAVMQAREAADLAGANLNNAQADEIRKAGQQVLGTYVQNARANVHALVTDSVANGEPMTENQAYAALYGVANASELPAYIESQMNNEAPTAVNIITQTSEQQGFDEQDQEFLRRAVTLGPHQAGLQLYQYLRQAFPDQDIKDNYQKYWTTLTAAAPGYRQPNFDQFFNMMAAELEERSEVELAMSRFGQFAGGIRARTLGNR